MSFGSDFDGHLATWTGSHLLDATQESARFNTTVTMVNLAVIVYVVCAGMPYAAGTNYRPFAPFGAHGVFAAASIVFFSFIGFDTVATTAEEVGLPQQEHLRPVNTGSAKVLLSAPITRTNFPPPPKDRDVQTATVMMKTVSSIVRHEDWYLPSCLHNAYAESSHTLAAS